MRYISADFQGALKIALGPCTKYAGLSPCIILDICTVAFLNDVPMNLTNMTEQLEEPLHCWPIWGRYISAAFEGALHLGLIPNVLDCHHAQMQTFLQ